MKPVITSQLPVRAAPAALLVALLSATLSADESASRQEPFRRANRKMLVGAMLAGAGLFLVPITAASSQESDAE
jgi:uncharacterized membrane protein YdcZ (DUF606 family)